MWNVGIDATDGSSNDVFQFHQSDWEAPVHTLIIFTTKNLSGWSLEILVVIRIYNLDLSFGLQWKCLTGIPWIHVQIGVGNHHAWRLQVVSGNGVFPAIQKTTWSHKSVGYCSAVTVQVFNRIQEKEKKKGLRVKDAVEPQKTVIRGECSGFLWYSWVPDQTRCNFMYQKI